MTTPAGSRCENCGAALPHAEGQVVRCTFCGREYAVPAPAPAAATGENAAEARIAEAMVELAAAARSARAHRGERRERRGGGCSSIGCGFFLLLLVAGGYGVYTYFGRNLGLPMLPFLSAASVRFCGSNTVGAELAPQLVQAYLTSRRAKNVRQETDGTTVKITATLPNDKDPFVVEIESGGTGTAFVALAQGECDVAMASRRALDSESAKLGTGLVENVIALDGIAVFVHPAVAVSSLDTGQLAAIFSGGALDAVAARGFGGAPRIVAHDDKSGTFDTFRTLVLGNRQLAASAQRFAASSDIVRAVATTPGSIGFTTLSAARGAKLVAVSEPSAPALLPNDLTIARESYPLTRRLYLYTHAGHTRPAADSLVAFALTAEGQRVVARLGFVDLSVKPESEPLACKDCPPEYLAATKGAERLSMDFRFLSGRSELDARAARDVERLVEFMNKKPGSKALLLGFADNRGSALVNQKLSLDRAESIKAELSRRGIGSVETRGFGSLMPVASNDTEQGRERNRRVEAWLFVH